MNVPLRVGIVGARGIGRHQAKWFSQLGCDLRALYGTTPETAAAAAEAVRALCPFRGRVESEWSRFIEAPDLDAVSICSPPEAHAANVLAALRAGKHVLCEKPLLWDWNASAEQMRQTACSLAQAAASTKRVLAMNAQYPAAVPALLDLYRRAHGHDPSLEQVHFLMETAGPPRSAAGRAEVWADLGPHPLAFFDCLLEGGTPEVATARCEPDSADVVLGLDWVRAGRRIMIGLELRRVRDRASIRRQFTLDGWTVAFEGRSVGGDFKAALVAPPHEWVGEDFMRVSIRQFLEAVRAGEPRQALVSGDAAVRQFEVQVALLGVIAGNSTGSKAGEASAAG